MKPAIQCRQIDDTSSCAEWVPLIWRSMFCKMGTSTLFVHALDDNDCMPTRNFWGYGHKSYTVLPKSSDFLSSDKLQIILLTILYFYSLLTPFWRLKRRSFFFVIDFSVLVAVALLFTGWLTVFASQSLELSPKQLIFWSQIKYVSILTRTLQEDYFDVEVKLIHKKGK